MTVTDQPVLDAGGKLPEEAASSWTLKNTSLKEVAGDRDRGPLWILCRGLPVAPGGWSEGHMCRGGDDRARGEAAARGRRSGFRCFLYFHGNLFKPRVELRSAVLKAASGEHFGRYMRGGERPARS